MSVQKMMAYAVDPDGKWLYQVGGISAFILGIAYIVIIALYIPIGAPPSDVEKRLTYLAANTTLWWAILGLSVLTDFLFVPVALALYLALQGINRNAMLIAITCVVLFVVLDLAITWPNYAALIALSGNYTLAADDTQRAALVAAAIYPAAVLESSLLGVYIILLPGIGILLSGLVMLKGIFNKATAYSGLVTGLLAIVTVVGPLYVSALGLTAVLASIMTTVWVLLVGYRLYRLGQR